MLAMGSKIFRRPHDLFLAERITDGCVVCRLLYGDLTT